MNLFYYEKRYYWKNLEFGIIEENIELINFIINIIEKIGEEIGTDINDKRYKLQLHGWTVH